MSAHILATESDCCATCGMDWQTMLVHTDCPEHRVHRWESAPAGTTCVYCGVLFGDHPRRVFDECLGALGPGVVIAAGPAAAPVTPPSTLPAKPRTELSDGRCYLCDRLHPGEECPLLRRR